MTNPGYPRKSLEFITKEFAKEGYTVTSKAYKNCKTPIKAICPRGHKVAICWNNFSRKKKPTRCKKCHLEDIQDTERMRKIEFRQGMYNVSEAARYLRLTESDMRRAIDRGMIPAPTHKIKGYIKRFYNEEELEQMDETIEEFCV